MRQTATKSARKVKSGAAHARKAVDDFVAAGNATVEQLKNAATDRGEKYALDARRRLEGWRAEATDYTRTEPVKALVTAFIAGFVTAAILRR